MRIRVHDMDALELLAARRGLPIEPDYAEGRAYVVDDGTTFYAVMQPADPGADQ